MSDGPPLCSHTAAAGASSINGIEHLLLPLDPVTAVSDIYDDMVLCPQVRQVDVGSVDDKKPVGAGKAVLRTQDVPRVTPAIA